MTSRFVCIKPVELRALVDCHQLSPPELAVLLWLTLEADHKTGLWRGTQAQLAEAVRLHRTNVRRHLARLEALGLIRCNFPKGHEGSVRVLPYLDVVHLPDSQVANHYLRDDMTPDRNDTKFRRANGGHKSQITTSEVVNRYLWTDETAGQGVVASGLVERHALGPSFALGGKDDEDSNRARALGENVIDFPRTRRVTSSPEGSTPSRAATASSRAALAGEPHPLDASLPRVSAGGGSEATPVHPRSLNDIPSSLAADVSHLRDPRAMGER